MKFGLEKMVNINDAQFYHSAKRCAERYQIRITRQQWRWMSNLIKNSAPCVKFVRWNKVRGKINSRKSVWKINIDAELCFLVAYDSALQNISTFLYPE